MSQTNTFWYLYSFYKFTKSPLDLLISTAKWIWDRSIYSVIKPSICTTLFQYFWRFTQICKKFAAFAHKIVFVIVSVVKLFRNNNKNNFASKCCKFLANLCKSSEILEQCHVNCWVDYRIYESASYSISCTKVFLRLSHRRQQFIKRSHFVSVPTNVWLFLFCQGFSMAVGSILCFWPRVTYVRGPKNRFCFFFRNGFSCPTAR